MEGTTFTEPTERVCLESRGIIDNDLPLGEEVISGLGRIQKSKPPLGMCHKK